jgi:hypothetical protein
VGQAVVMSIFHNDRSGLLVLCHRCLSLTTYAKLKQKGRAQKRLSCFKNIPPLSLSKQALMLIKRISFIRLKQQTNILFQAVP